MELVKTNVDKAYEYAKSLFDKKGLDIEKKFPNFKKNYEFAKKQASGGKTKRADMPVIDEKDVKDFQKRLANGYIDWKPPFKEPSNKKDPFPEGLRASDAQEWLTAGKGDESGDGEWPDDKIKAKLGKETVGKLKPIQKQIYADKSIEATIQFGIDVTKNFLQSQSTFIISSDNFIIDGHHRYLSGLLIDPKMKVNVLRVEAPISKLLPMSLSYSDAVGNKRNL